MMRIGSKDEQSVRKKLEKKEQIVEEEEGGEKNKKIKGRNGRMKEKGGGDKKAKRKDKHGKAGDKCQKRSRKRWLKMRIDVKRKKGNEEQQTTSENENMANAG